MAATILTSLAVVEVNKATIGRAPVLLLRDGKGREKKEAETGGDCVVRLYSKGLVSEEVVRDSKVVVAGLGVAICDPRDNLVFEARKNVAAFDGDVVVSNEAVELEALIEGLNTTLTLELRHVTFCCEGYMLYQYWKEIEVSLISSIPNAGSREAAAVAAAVRAVGGDSVLDDSFALERVSSIARRICTAQLTRRALQEFSVLCVF